MIGRPSCPGCGYSGHPHLDSCSKSIVNQIAMEQLRNAITPAEPKTKTQALKLMREIRRKIALLEKQQAAQYKLALRLLKFPDDNVVFDYFFNGCVDLKKVWQRVEELRKIHG